MKADVVTDTDLAIFRELFDAENYRRQQLATIPREIAHRREQYIALGGDPDDLD
ncbi:MAG: hypothetical protein Q4P36_07620 [Bowdeniella nasicola]|nr:hypothetical protein [Bowdeniella nasicola]